MPDKLQSPITNLQLLTILPAQISSRTLHHPANPLYPYHPPSSLFLDPRSLLVSSFPTEPYPRLYHVSGTILLLNFTHFRFLHHSCQSPTIICLRLLYPSPLVLSTQNCFR